MKRGAFVVIEGPSGVGKSSVIAAVETRLREKISNPLHLARQPSLATLGVLARELTDQLPAESLACLVAADRYEQLATEIRPRVRAGYVVLCDRYVPSSLVLQVMDGVDESLVRAINARTDVPDLYVFLEGEPHRSRQRSHERGPRDRFHRQLQPEAEAERYRLVASDLRAEGRSVAQLVNIGRTVEATASEVVRLISNLGHVVRTQ